MKVTLLAHTPNPVDVVAQAAAICRRSTPSNELVAKIIAAGHESVLEHVTFTFRVEGISRACLAQLTRHRLASYSVESQRSVDCCGDDDYSYAVQPHYRPDIDDGLYEKTWRPARSVAILSRQVYRYLVDLGIPKEDARLVLPEGTTTNLIFTMNARELRHCFRLRLSEHAQWEIRKLFELTLGQVMNVCPELFPEWVSYDFTVSPHEHDPFVLRPYLGVDKETLVSRIRSVQCRLTELHTALIKGYYYTDCAFSTYDELVRTAAIILDYMRRNPE